MAQFAYHASHEQFSPSELIRYTSLAAEGFDAISSSDQLIFMRFNFMLKFH